MVPLAFAASWNSPSANRCGPSQAGTFVPSRRAGSGTSSVVSTSMSPTAMTGIESPSPALVDAGRGPSPQAESTSPATVRIDTAWITARVRTLPTAETVPGLTMAAESGKAAGQRMTMSSQCQVNPTGAPTPLSLLVGV